MPLFTARIFSAPGLALATWVDPATVAAPSRINPNPAHLPTYTRIVPPGTIVAKATFGGVEGPTDVAMGSRRFKWWWIEWSGVAPLSISLTLGSSSIATIAGVTADHAGHHVLGVSLLADGGGLALPFDVEV